MREPVTVKKGSEIELKIESLAFGGMGLAKLDDFVIFVKNGIPGQYVNVFIYKKKKGFAEARVTKIIDESPYATESKCSHHWICSKLQGFSYDQQLKEKEKQVEDAFQRLGGFSDFKLNLQSHSVCHESDPQKSMKIKRNTQQRILCWNL